MVHRWWSSVFPIILLSAIFTATVYSFQFQDNEYSNLEKQAFELKGPFAIVGSAQERYGTSPATSGDRSCSPAIISVTEVESYSSDVQRPQLLISGEIHGDERVGPSSSLYAALLLVHSAYCEIKKQSESCELVSKAGVTKSQQMWLSFLATRRETIIIPTANCLGYISNRRDDAGVDPNRDFAYSRTNSDCLKSATAKILYAVSMQNIIQIVVTFHGGMVSQQHVSCQVLQSILRHIFHRCPIVAGCHWLRMGIKES